MSQQQHSSSFATVPRGEDFKEEFEGFYQESLTPEALKRVKKYSRPEKEHSAPILIVLALLALIIVVIAVNYYFSAQMISLLKTGSAQTATGEASSASGQLEKKLKELEASQLKILNKITELSTKISSLDKTTVNVVDSDSVSNQPPADSALKHELETLAKDMSVIKSDLGTANKNIVAETLANSNAISELKDLVLKSIDIVESNFEERGEEGQPKKVKVRDERAFEADFVTEFEDSKEEKFNENSLVYVGVDYIFNIPKKLWMFKKVGHQNYLDELCYNNNVYFANQSNFELHLVDRSNYKTFLTPKTAEKVGKVIQLLEKRVAAKESSNLKYHFDDIVKQLILLNILNDNGGLTTTGEFAMTEDLSWIANIITNIYANHGNRGIKPQVVGFYSSDYSFEKHKEAIKPFDGMHDVDRYMTLFPALENYFIAAEKSAAFIARIIERIVKLLQKPDSFKRERGHYKLNNLKGEDMYYEYFLLAVQTTLQDKQKEIDSIKIDSDRHFAIDFYGLYLINCFYAPYKLKAFWGNGQSSKAFQSLSQYSQEELFANIGPLRYILRVTPTDEMSGYLLDTKNGRRNMIMQGSFLQKIFYPNGSYPFIKKNQEKFFVNSTNQPWTALPKKIWIFWDTGLANAGVNNQICVENIRRMGKASGFEVIEVNMSNIKQYLAEEVLLRIETTIAHAQLKTYPQSKGDLYRLALLAEYGGIYMDASYIALQSFEWLVNIGKYPSQYIFNRYGHLPKVFMMWHPHYGSPLEWTINEKYNIKSQWHLAYENNFIAAEKHNELIKEWFDLLLSLYVKPYPEVQKVFQECLMYNNKWSTSNWHYLIPMDTIKCVIGRREVSLAQLPKDAKKEFESASDYYRLWSMSGYLGQQKLRSNTNFQSPGSQDNLFVYRYSQDYVEGLIGKIRHVAKFYSQHNKQLTNFVSRHMDGNFSSEAHPDSVFMKHMWHPKFKLEQKNFYPLLKVLP